jgi:hypothetical protein
VKCKIANYNFCKLQYFIGVLFFTLVSIIFTSCSTNKYSQSDINQYLTTTRVKAKTSPISFRIPQGWHLVDANNKAFIDLWILRDDMNVSLSLLPFHSNSSKFLLSESYESSILLQQVKYKNKLKILREKSIHINNMDVLFYSFDVEKKKFRVALFKIESGIYELTLFGNNTNIKIEYFIQELFISSAKFEK